MHWFWRAAISIVPGTLVGVVFWMAFIDTLGEWHFAGAVVMVILTPVLSHGTAIYLYHIVTLRPEPWYGSEETRCRKCGYILRGITEPRRPECGERI